MSTLDNSSSERAVPSLAPIAMAALDAGRTLMEAGASARNVTEIVGTVAHGLGAEQVELRIGYASLAITVVIGQSSVTRMRSVGWIGVNQRLNQRLWELAGRISQQELTAEQSRSHLALLATETPRHGMWVTAIAVGLACASFGLLLGTDWRSIGPIFVAATIGQYLRGKMLAHRVNAFIVTALVSFLSSALCGFGAHWSGGVTVGTAMIASVLLLVPGIPAVNAQIDVLEGYPTLGSARMVTVAMTFMFIAAGLWFARVLVSHFQ